MEKEEKGKKIFYRLLDMEDMPIFSMETIEYMPISSIRLYRENTRNI